MNVRAATIEAAGRREPLAERRFEGAALREILGVLAREGASTHVRALVQRLSQQPPRAFASLAALHAVLGIEGQPKRRTIAMLRDLFVTAADVQLQALYRAHLATAGAGEGHDARVAALAGVREEAQAIVDGCGWAWLAEWLDLARIGEDAAACVARLSNLAFDVATVNFRFTYHCNIACRHCYNSSGPGRKSERIALDRMLGIIAQMPGAGLRRLILTGGEPFLYVDDVLAMIAAAREAGVERISINSNGFWGNSDARARQMLERLARAGFLQSPEDHLKISSGVYHTEFVDLERIFAIARAHDAVFARPLLIDFELTEKRPELREEALARFEAAGLTDKVELTFRGIELLGRAQDLEPANRSAHSMPCNIIDQIAFDPDGSVRPCCGLNNENQGVVIGEIERHSLRELVKRMQNDPVLQFIARNPLDAIFAETGGAAQPEGYAGLCELCQHAIGDIADKEPLQARLFGGQRFYPFWFEAHG